MIVTVLKQFEEIFTVVFKFVRIWLGIPEKIKILVTVEQFSLECRKVMVLSH